MHPTSRNAPSLEAAEVSRRAAPIISNLNIRIPGIKRQYDQDGCEMDNLPETALQYSQKHGLFHSHRHVTFSPQRCLASIQTCLDSPTNLFEDEGLSDNIDFPNSAEIFGTDLLTSGVQDEPVHIVQTAPPFSYPSGTIHDMLLGLPDMGQGYLTDAKHFSDISGIAPRKCLATQYLPLISIDRKKDEGLDFPPYVDRLHQALQYKVDNEPILYSGDLPKQGDQEARSKSEVE